jgi:hypothetical protein
MVSTVHTGKEKVKKDRKKPRVTSTNRNNLVPVWGNEFVVSIEIPGMINDYNHWMLGVDKADQLISYYRPDLRCRRTWMPLVMHALDIIRINCFAIAKSSNNKLEHKDFIVSLVDSLLQRASSSQEQATRSRLRVSPRQPPSGKKRRTSHVNPTLPEYRFNGEPRDHIASIASKQRRCIYCCYLRQVAVASGTPKEELPSTRKVSRYCISCQDHLCINHFSLFHTDSTEEI